MYFNKFDKNESKINSNYKIQIFDNLTEIKNSVTHIYLNNIFTPYIKKKTYYRTTYDKYINEKNRIDINGGTILLNPSISKFNEYVKNIDVILNINLKNSFSNFEKFFKKNYNIAI